MSSGRSLSLPLVIGVIIIVAIVASSLTYYYASLNLPTVTSQTTITSTTTATKSVTMTETSTVTVTKTVTKTTTLPPSTITLTVTTASTTTPSGKVIVIPRNDTAAQRLAEFELKHQVLTSVVIWLIWMKIRDKLPPPILDPATALADRVAMTLTSQDVVALPPLTSGYSIRYVRSLIAFHPTQEPSNETCLPINIESNAHGVANTSVVLEPVNSSAITVRVDSKLPMWSVSFNAVMMLMGNNTLKIVETSGAGTTLTRITQVTRNDLPVMMKEVFKGITNEASINSSNGALIIRTTGSVIRVVEDAEPALKKIRDSLHIVVTYDGSDRVLDNIIAPRYRVFMSGFVKVRMGNITFSIDLNYGGTAYLLGSDLLVFTTNTVGNLQVGVATGSNTYCRYLKEPLVTHVKLEAFSTS